MTDVQSIQWAETYGATPVGKNPSNINYGRERIMFAEFEATGEAIGADILIGKITEGARIHDVVLFTDALGASSTLSLVLRDDAAAITVVTAAAATSSAGRKVPATADIANLPSPAIVGGADVMLRSAGGTITGTIKVFITFVVD